MKVNILDAHDRLLTLRQSQETNIFQGIEDCLKHNPNCIDMQKHFPWVYIFAHPRTADDGYTKRMLFQPRLLKPRAQTNSYLFRVISNTDLVEVIWLLPPRELWAQFEQDKLTESRDVMISINNFIYHRSQLEAPHKDDWTEEKIRKKLLELRRSIKPTISEVQKVLSSTQADSQPNHPSSSQ